MKNLSLGAHASFLVLIFSMLLTSSRTHPFSLGEEAGSPFGAQDHLSPKEDQVGMELYPTGSSLPDCSHACGPCFPCKRVIVSFKCSTESCPIVYRCTCKGKFYHVPSN
ncbi:hypothetical protein FH972_018222 [Carpinus fangiana]|uniref:Epidermal patterning factor-like protein n=1 Tax=Carpinus fangiana TaxID=176857 RepID=A0A5N6RLI3_9ROSI|nr:hypothetical protein FH972_018222 [Carpinus fangiana]